VDHELDVCLLGSFLLKWQNEAVQAINSPRLQTLLAYLLLNRDKPLSRRQLAFQFWPDTSEAQAFANLRTLLTLLRRVLPEADRFILVGRRTLEWQGAAAFRLDVADFERALAEGDLEQAVNVYGGDLLPDCYDDWIQPDRDRLRQNFGRALEKVIQTREEARDYEAAICYAQTYLQHDPLSEGTYRRLIRLYAAAGNRTAALRQYENCAMALERELGVEPLPETRAAYEAALQGERQADGIRVVTPEWSVIPSLQLPLMGRDAAWQALKRAHERFERGGLILLQGEAGIGKSRLMQEFASRQARLVLTGNCHATTQTLPYQPIVQALRQALAQPALWQSIRPIWLTEAARLLPELPDAFPSLPAPIEVKPDQAQARLYEALCQCFLGLAAQTPVLLCLDDLHWADDATRGWLATLAAKLAGSDLCLLAAYRLEEAAAVAGVKEPFLRRSLLAEVSLSGLSAEAVCELLGRLPQPPPEPGTLAERIASATAGNPFFVLETVRTLLERDLLACPAGELPLARTVHEAVEERLGRLSPVARQVVESAAVLAPDLQFELIQQTAGRSELEVADGLDELVRRQLLLDGEQHQFKHDLLAQVAYQHLTAGRRRLLHRRAAEAFGRVYQAQQENVAAQMARHYDVAGEGTEALRHLTRAARAAQQIYAHEEALRYLQRTLALAAVNERPVLGQLHEQTGDVLALLDRHDEAISAYQESMRHIPADHQVWESRIHCKEGNSWRSLHRYAEAMQAYKLAEQALDRRKAESDSHWWQEWIRIQLEKMWVCYWLAQWQTSSELADEVRPALDQCGTLSHKADFFALLGATNLRRERHCPSAETINYVRNALETARKLGNPGVIALYGFGLGFCLLWRGELAEAEEHLQAALELAERTENAVLRSRCLTYLTLLYRKRGQKVETAAYAIRSRASAEATQMLEYAGTAEANLAWVAWQEGDGVRTFEHGRTALELWGKLPAGHASCAFQWTALFPLISVSLTQHELEQAIAYARAILQPPQQRLPDALTALLQQAIAAWEQSEPQVAANHMEPALQLAQATGFL
jgi:DNA-binding SARP family transcriptional activator